MQLSLKVRFKEKMLIFRLHHPRFIAFLELIIGLSIVSFICIVFFFMIIYLCEFVGLL